MLTEFYSSRTLRNLVLSSSDGAAVAFVKLLWAGVFKDRCQQFVGKRPTMAKGVKLRNGSNAPKRPQPGTDWQLCSAGNHAEKVLAALLECGCESVKQAAHEQLKVGVTCV